MLEEHGFNPARRVIDHNNEETVRAVLDCGFYAGFSIYSGTKMGNARMAALKELYESQRIVVDSACNWGVSDPLAVPKTAQLMLARELDAAVIRQVTCANALAVDGLNGEMQKADWETPALDQSALYLGNSVLRGGQTPRITQSGRAPDQLEII